MHERVEVREGGVQERGVWSMCWYTMRACVHICACVYIGGLRGTEEVCMHGK